MTKLVEKKSLLRLLTAFKKKTKSLTDQDYFLISHPDAKRLLEQQALLEILGLKNPYFIESSSVSSPTITVDQKELINFSSYNYLNYSGETRVNKAVEAALKQYGSSVSASRLVAGEKTIHRELENELATFLGVEDAAIFSSGYLTAFSTIGHLMSPKDLILYDSLIHNCNLVGSMLSGARRMAFEHNDIENLDMLLREHRHHYENVLILTEGLFSMDGDIAPLPDLIKIKNKHHAWLFVDEAHSIGTIGQSGKGVSEYHQCDPKDVEIWFGTLSKSLASCGGYIAGDENTIGLIKYSSPGFLYSAGISPMNTAAALEALNMLKEETGRLKQLSANSHFIQELAEQAGLDVAESHPDTPIIPIILGSSVLAIQLSQKLRENGILALPILYPVVEDKKARIRLFINACHTKDQLQLAIEKVCHFKKELEGSLLSKIPFEKLYKLNA